MILLWQADRNSITSTMLAAQCGVQPPMLGQQNKAARWQWLIMYQCFILTALHWSEWLHTDLEGYIHGMFHEWNCCVQTHLVHKIVWLRCTKPYNGQVQCKTPSWSCKISKFKLQILRHIHTLQISNSLNSIASADWA